MNEETNIITYETLYDMLRREKSKIELQEIDQNFYDKIINYLKEKKDILESQQKKQSIFTTIEVQKTRKQIDNIYKILKELYEKRENKIIHLALINSKSEHELNESTIMIDAEIKFYEKIKKILDSSRNELLYGIINGTKKQEVREEQPKHLKTEVMPKKTKKVKILKAMPSFIGTDLKTHGPFEAGDETTLPIEIVNLLSTANHVEELK
jgi:DNA replication initiation complex subunit (GINS family)